MTDRRGAELDVVSVTRRKAEQEVIPPKKKQPKKPGSSIGEDPVKGRSRSAEIPKHLQYEKEDEFTGYYEGGPSAAKGAALIAPSYHPQTLENLMFHNNTLLPCVDAIVTNCQRTGFDIHPKPEVFRAWAQEKRKDFEKETGEPGEDPEEVGGEGDFTPKDQDEKAMFGKGPAKPKAPGDPTQTGEQTPPEQDGQKSPARSSEEAQAAEQVRTTPGRPTEDDEEEAARRKKKPTYKVFPFPSKAAAKPGEKDEEDDEDKPFGKDEDGEPELDENGFPKPKPKFEEPSMEQFLKEHADEISSLQSFFDQPYPGESFVTQRAKFGYDFEVTGNAFFEVLRNLEDDVVCLRHLPSRSIRIVQLDDPVKVETKVKRAGLEITLSYWKRERRFASMAGRQPIFYREYGASRSLNRRTGAWIEKTDSNGQPPISPDDLASEVIWRRGFEDPKSPYGIPRWIAELPSVLGSREAEDYNLTWFEQGGVPPFMILVHGGSVNPQVTQKLAKIFQKGGFKHEIPIVSAVSTSGSMDSPSTTRVTVERFGSEKLQDSLFENYDRRCAERIASVWRLPEIFMGKAGSYTYASAYTSYMVGEAQVFAPVRFDFDEMVNLLLMPELDESGKYLFRSRPVVITDANVQLTALGMVTNDVSRDERIRALNEITGLKLIPRPEEEQPEGVLGGGLANLFAGGAQQEGLEEQKGMPPAIQQGLRSQQPNKKGLGGVQKGARRLRKHEAIWLTTMADQAADAMHNNPANLVPLYAQVSKLADADVEVFNYLLAAKIFGDTSEDRQGGAALAGCAMAMLAANQGATVARKTF